MKNKLPDLNNILFEQLERLNDDEALADPEAFERELERSKAITGLATQVVNNAKLALDAKKYIDEYGDKSAVPTMLQIEDKQSDNK